MVPAARFQTWLATTPWAWGLTPVTMDTWVGQVVLGNTTSMPEARAPRSASARRVGRRACGSSQ